MQRVCDRAQQVLSRGLVSLLTPCLEGLHPEIAEQTKEAPGQISVSGLLCDPDKQTTLSGLYFSPAIDFTEESGGEGEKGGREQSPFRLRSWQRERCPYWWHLRAFLPFARPRFPQPQGGSFQHPFSSQAPERFSTPHPEPLEQVRRPGQHSHRPQGWPLA